MYYDIGYDKKTETSFFIIPSKRRLQDDEDLTTDSI